jgi:hypothetical protein
MTEESFGRTNAQHQAHYVMDLQDEIARLKEELAAAKAQGGPIDAERMTLDELLEVLAKWKAVASGSTCVSFECLCFGASSLWHQTHRENFRKVDRKPKDLSRWVLKHDGSVRDDFPAQVLGILIAQQKRIDELERLNLEAQSRNGDLCMLIGHIEQCRAVEGDSVTILCDNPEADSAETQGAVEVCGGYTGYELQRFYGKTWEEAIATAARVAQRHYAE